MIQSTPQTALADNAELRKFITIFGRMMEAKLWISDGQETTVVKSFSGPIPPLDSVLEKHRVVNDHVVSVL